MSDDKKKTAPTDFNDLHLIAGLDVVGRQLDAALGDAQRSFRGVEDDQEDDPDASEAFPGEQVANAPPMEVYTQDESVAAMREQPWYKNLSWTKNGGMATHAGNLESILLHDPRWKGVLAYCDFSYRVTFRKKVPMQTKSTEWTDADAARLRIWLHRNYPMGPPPHSEIADALITVAQRESFHPVREYLEKLRWDDEPRLSEWLSCTFHAADREEYLAIIGKRFLIGAVARVMSPGCKMDNVLILEGEQGKGKSTAVGVLFGDWFSDSPLPLGDKDSYQLIHGVWGYELAELDSFNKAETTQAKAFFSQRRDRYRPSYGRNAQDFPRQTVFVGTTNQEEYLKDYSGNRRYLPVKCRTVDLDWLRENRDQLWAEALQLFRDGEPWWVAGDEERELVEYEQDTRLQRDPWEDTLRDYLASNTSDHFSSYTLLTEAIGFDAAHIQRAHQGRIAPIMKALGWHKSRMTVPDPLKKDRKRQQWVYVRPASDVLDEPFGGKK